MAEHVSATSTHQPRARGNRRYQPRLRQNQANGSGRGGHYSPTDGALHSTPPHSGSLNLQQHAASSTQLLESTRGRGRGRGGPRRGNSGQARINQGNRQPTIQAGGLQGRQFGGHLTSDASIATSQGVQHGQLHGDATEFVPGQAQQPKPQAQPSRNRQRRYSKSTAADLATRTHEDIEHGVYECPICTNEILRNSKVWSCHTCWTVFHLSCIKKWASNAPSPQQWRCPGCNLPKDAQPKAYRCWCEKELDPRPVTGLPPHSCGQTCNRERTVPQKCPHRCDSTCHAGPCSPCDRMGPTQSCFCGKITSTKRCTDTNYEKGWSCEQVCGDLMPCGEHTCQKRCHEGLCGACEMTVEAHCYCGQVEKSIPCCDRGDEKSSARSRIDESGQTSIDQWVGQFDCGNRCNRQFDCGKHHCEKACHPQTANVEHCPRSPDMVTKCPCGKTSLDEISLKPRQTCEDAIPRCTKQCGKRLSCGHSCEQACHSGECMPCLKKVSISCRCGRTSSETLCHQGNIVQPQCMRLCNSTLNCGRHSCDERCCTGERRALERQSYKRKMRPVGSAPNPRSDFEAEHICTRICGRPLKCGNHTCQDLCHKGPCPSCREAIFDEIPCACGRTVLSPPLPCGTKPPACRFQCERPKTCGHPQVPHNCHQEDEACPKCPFLTSKICLCGKKTLNNQPCWLPSVRCGGICGRKLKCGSHTCRKTCHAPGECEDADTTLRTCQQACGKPKKACEHPCEDQCHAPFPCREEKPCSHKIFITCPCQTLKVEARCNASKHDPEGNGKKELKCDDECARLERNRKLALALNIDQSTHTDDHVPYSQDTLNLYQENGTQWAQQQEREFRVFSSAEEEKRLRFKPMSSLQRAFIHALAEDFGLDSESMDPEPYRHIALYKTPRFVSAPNKTIGECIRIRMKQRNGVAPASVTNDGLPKKETRSNLLGDPYNGFLLTRPRFGLTIEELRSIVHSAVPAGSIPSLEISFLPNEEVLLKAKFPGVPEGRAIAAEREGETILRNAKASLAGAVSSKGIGSLQLCRADESLNVLRKEADEASVSGTGGWSQVAAKGASRREVKSTALVAGRNGFEVLGQSSKVVLAKKKKEKPAKDMSEVVDDWEKAMTDEEEKEKAAGGEVSEDVKEMNDEAGNAKDEYIAGDPPAPEDAALDVRTSEEAFRQDAGDESAVEA